MKVEAGENFNEVCIFMDWNVVLFCEFDEFFSDRPCPFANYSGSRIFFLIVAESNGFFSCGFDERELAVILQFGKPVVERTTPSAAAVGGPPWSRR